MVSNQPYLIRAFYDWIVDSMCTPHILVDASLAGVNVPPEHVTDDKIVLNIAAQSVEGLNLSNEWITFHARFSGKQVYIEVPVHAVQGIYAKENGEGIAFQTSLDAGAESLMHRGDKKPAPAKRPGLRVVK